MLLEPPVFKRESGSETRGPALHAALPKPTNLQHMKEEARWEAVCPENRGTSAQDWGQQLTFESQSGSCSIPVVRTKHQLSDGEGKAGAKGWRLTSYVSGLTCCNRN
jgi:hypothetical protein